MGIRLRKKFGQSAIEYAMIIGVIAIALVAMNVYVQRSAQANLKLIEEQIIPEEVAGSSANFGP